jgi:hypothetical protein
MKFALVNGQRQEAEPGQLGQCPACGHPTLAKCGKVRIWHWAHRGRLSCDPWWENETEWHRAWKGQFPIGWQEVVHQAVDGEKHIADVKTDEGWVIEFQHSPIKPEERRTRDAFYGKLVWVVDGLRRKRDVAQFETAWNQGVPVGGNASMRKVFSDECVLLREWIDSPVPVFFDFGGAKSLWWLLRGSPNGQAYVAEFPCAGFVHIHRSGETDKTGFTQFVRDLGKLLADYELAMARNQVARQPLHGFEQHLVRRRTFRRRF